MAKRLDHNFKKCYGQNFLHDFGIIRRIVDAINPGEGQSIVEIGPGLGALTEPLFARTHKMSVIEIDKELVARLKKHFGDNNKLSVYEADVLTFDFAKLIDQSADKIRVVGNLPYNIATPLLFHLTKYLSNIADMHFMLQKEVADRIVAVPGNKKYGRLSVMMQYFCRCEKLFNVAPGAFYPVPKVDSAVVRLVPYEHAPYPVKDLISLEVVVKNAFSTRRKMLANTLKFMSSREELVGFGIDPNARAENLSLKDFVKLANILYSIGRET